MWSKLAKISYSIISLLIAIGIVISSISYFEPNFNKGFLIGKKAIFPYFKYALYIHMISSPIIFLTGLFQFLFPKTKIHTKLGALYVLLILFIAAPSGAFMSFFAIGGIPSIILFFILSVLWFYYTIVAYKHGKSGNRALHVKFIIGSFILTNSAIFLRLLSYLNNQFKFIEGEYSYTIISALSWVPALIIYELVYFFRREKKGSHY